MMGVGLYFLEPAVARCLSTNADLAMIEFRRDIICNYTYITAIIVRALITIEYNEEEDNCVSAIPHDSSIGQEMSCPKHRRGSAISIGKEAPKIRS